MSSQDELYEWIQSRYQQCVNGEISEDVYLKDLEEYNKKVEKITTEKKEVKKVRSTSIAGLRSKLLDELKKD